MQYDCNQRTRLIDNKTVEIGTTSKTYEIEASNAAETYVVQGHKEDCSFERKGV